MIVERGVWHAEPQPVSDGVLCEMIETAGAADRLDRQPLSDLLGIAAVRVSLPEEPADPVAT